MYKILKNTIEMDDYSVQKLSNLQPPEPFEWNTIEGTELNVSDCIGGKGKIEVKGNTEQEQLSGKNVLDPSTIGTGTINGINYSYDENTQEITLNGTCTKDNTLISFVHTNIIASASKTNFCAYCVDGSISGYGTLRFYDANYMAGCILYINELTKGNYILKQVKESYEAVNNNFRFNAGTVCNNFKIKVMVTDSTDTTYEPYCGGQAAPNPSYEIPIKVVTGDNVVKHVGKNKFSLQNKLKSVASSVTSSISDSSTNSFIMVGKNVWGNQSVLFDNLKNKNLSLSAIYTNRASVNTRIRLQAYGVNVIDYVSADLVNLGIVDYNSTDKNPHKLSITFNSGDYEYILFRFWNNATSTVLSENTDMLVDNIQLEENTTPTQYEPYREETFNLNLGNLELCKIGDYEDILFKNVIGDENYNAELEDGAWYKKSAIAEVVLDGRETWNYNSGNRYFFTNKFLDNYVTQYTKLVSNNYIGGMASNGGLYNNHIQTGTAYSFMICDNRFTDKNDLKTWLSTHNTIVKYPLATPTYEKITDPTLISQLEALRKAKWFKGINHWWTETNNLEPVLKGTYRQAINE